MSRRTIYIYKKKEKTHDCSIVFHIGHGQITATAAYIITINSEALCGSRNEKKNPLLKELHYGSVARHTSSTEIYSKIIRSGSDDRMNNLVRTSDRAQISRSSFYTIIVQPFESFAFIFLTVFT